MTRISSISIFAMFITTLITTSCGTEVPPVIPTFEQTPTPQKDISTPPPPDTASPDVPHDLCEYDTDCDDEDICTKNWCNPNLGCNMSPVPNCCTNDDDCDDGNPATVEQCNEINACEYGIKPDMCLIDDAGLLPGEVALLDRCLSCQPDISQTEFTPIDIGLDCDDGDLCTIDGCDPTPCYKSDDPTCDPDKPGCTHETVPRCCIADTDCIDDDVCNGMEACMDNTCVDGKPLVCNDGNDCNGEETCDKVKGCQPGIPPDETCCTTDTDCNSTCWTSSCDSETGTCSKSTPVDCSDDDPCTIDGSCDPETGCADPAPIDCDDDDACTDDSCNLKTGECTHEPIKDCCSSDDECTDEDTCNGVETCTNNVCVMGTPIDCNDGDPCTDDSCNIETGECTHKPINECCKTDADCIKGDPCNGTWTCTTGQCVPGKPLDCTDEDPCTLDTCKNGECKFLVLVCNDGDICNGIEICNPETGCTNGTPIDCNDDNPCTTDYCNPETGECVHKPIGDDDCCTSDTECNVDDGKICTIATCSDDHICITQFVEDGTGCNDGDACTTDDTCLDGDCSGKLMTCADDDPCTTDSCQDGTCMHKDIVKCCMSDDDCIDSNVCNGLEACVNDVCIPGKPIVCDDSNPCTTDVCESTGCTFTPNTDPCNDGNGCTSDDICTDGTCIGTATDCDDGDKCTIDSCQNDSCQHKKIDGCCTSDADCNDNNLCTLDMCFNSSCQHLLVIGCCTANIECDDNVSCTIDTCEGNLCVHTTDDNLCDDNDVCTDKEICNTIAGCKHKTIVCDDGNVCTTDVCNPVKGCVYTNNTIICDDGDPCTINDKCGSGICHSGSFLNCNDENPCTEDICIPGANTCLNPSIPGCTP